jgi:hypothetical protein
MPAAGATRHRPWPLVAAALIALAAGACATPAYTAGPGPFLGPLEPGAIRYLCREFPFDPAVLDGPATAEQADTPFAEALRKLIEPPVNPILPKTGWRLLGSDADSAEFVTGAVAEGLSMVAIEPWEGLLRALEAGSCQPKLVYPPGTGLATWELAADDRPLTAESTTFLALVTERDCASGRAAIGRILGPTISYLDDRVLVAFGVAPQTEEGGVTCQGNPSVPIRVELSEPLGDRVLVDPALLPVAEFRVPG